MGPKYREYIFFILSVIPSRTFTFWLLIHTSKFDSYFMIAKKGLLLDGSTPTLLYGYGGFEISLGPRYATTVGISWLERGGVYVEANIRGGGEYGPKVSLNISSLNGNVGCWHLVIIF